MNKPRRHMDKDSPWPYPPPLNPPPCPFSPAALPHNPCAAIPDSVHHCQPSRKQKTSSLHPNTDANVISPRKGPSDTTNHPSLTSRPVWPAAPPPSLGRAPRPGCHGDAPSPPCRWRPRHPSPQRRPGTWRGSYPLASVAVGSGCRDAQKTILLLLLASSTPLANTITRIWGGEGEGGAVPSCSRRSTTPGFVGMSCVGSGEAPMGVVMMRKSQGMTHKTYKA
jgi:hypothetical protein